MNAAGFSRLADQRISREGEGNKAGRVGRTCNGLATFLFDVDDSELGMELVSSQMEASD